MHYCDSHCHLQFNPRDQVAQVIEEAKEANIRTFFCNATREEDWEILQAMRNEFSGIMPWYGIHPWWAHTVRPGWQRRLRAFLKQEQTSSPLGLGEIGLDKRCPVPMDEQYQVFVQQLQIARAGEYPLTIHAVRCWGKILATVQTLWTHQDYVPPIILHGYSGSLEITQQFLGLDKKIRTENQATGPSIFFSFSPRILQRNQRGNTQQYDLQKLLQLIPINQILLETDSPRQAGQQSLFYRPEAVQKPAVLIQLYALAAEIKNISFLDFCQHIQNNAAIFTNRTLFR